MKLKVGDRVLMKYGVDDLKANHCYRVTNIRASCVLGETDMVYEFNQHPDGWFISTLDARIERGEIKIVSYGEDKKYL